MGLFDKNIGTADKVVRLFVALALLSAVYLKYVREPLSYLFGLAGLALLLTVATGSCVLYNLIGLDTREKGAARKAAPAKGAKRKAKGRRKR